MTAGDKNLFDITTAVGTTDSADKRENLYLQEILCDALGNAHRSSIHLAK